MRFFKRTKDTLQPSSTSPSDDRQRSITVKVLSPEEVEKHKADPDGTVFSVTIYNGHLYEGAQIVTISDTSRLNTVVDEVLRGDLPRVLNDEVLTMLLDARKLDGNYAQELRILALNKLLPALASAHQRQHYAASLRLAAEQNAIISKYNLR